ncbi:MAG: energy-coupling factor transporter transmembrane component T [Tissierellia bacterium]|nr:energy-coupling factor transporter transmembrane component T [Tissierellia bacterium]
MLKDITIGQYFPGDSFVHKLDPRIKLIISILYIIMLFMTDSYIAYLIVFISLIFVIRISKIPVGMILKGIKPLKYIILITFLMNIIFTKGETLFVLGPIAIAKEGIDMAAKMAIRLIMLIMGTSMLTLTTSPIQLTDGLESLLSPLKKIGFPVHSLAMMMTIAIRFVPTLIEEMDKIMKAQMARGADFDTGNIFQRAKSLVPILVPLFISALRRADELATAMDARCYRGDDGRTKLNPLKYEQRDFVALFCYLVFFILIANFSRIQNLLIA